MFSEAIHSLSDTCNQVRRKYLSYFLWALIRKLSVKKYSAVGFEENAAFLI
jgi:hypothetical protein